MFCYAVNYFMFCGVKGFTPNVMCITIHSLTKEMVPKQKQGE